MGNKLAIAFGARGKGGAMAHYEPDRNVINLTKMKGAGALAHEWGHALDYHLGELYTGTHNTAMSELRETYVGDEKYQVVFEAFKAVMRRILREPGVEDLNIYSYKELEESLIDNRYWLVEQARKHGADQGEVERAAYRYKNSKPNNQKKDLGMCCVRVCNTLQNATFDSKEDEERYYMIKARAQVMFKMNRTEMTNSRLLTASEFYINAVKLDTNRSKSYYSSKVELFARAFEAFIQDELAHKGIQSDYLVHSTNRNEVYRQLYMGSPYPAGQDRADINTLMRALIALYRTVEFNGQGYHAGLKNLYQDKSAIKETYRDSQKAKTAIQKGVTSGELSRESSVEKVDAVVQREIHKAPVNDEVRNLRAGNISKIEHLEKWLTDYIGYEKHVEVSLDRLQAMAQAVSEETVTTEQECIKALVKAYETNDTPCGKNTEALKCRIAFLIITNAMGHTQEYKFSGAFEECVGTKSFKKQLYEACFIGERVVTELMG